MNSRLFLFLALGALAAGCAADPSAEDVEASQDELRARVTDGSFKMYNQPRQAPSAACDVSTRLELSNAPLGVATLTDGVDGVCDLHVPENRREFQLHSAGTSCGSTMYTGRVRMGSGYRTIKITDHRTRVCDDVVPARLVVEESLPGFPGRITTTLYSYDAQPEAASTWLVISPKQCGTNPWERASLRPNSILSGEAGKVDTFFKTQGIALESVALLHATEARFVCMACSCPRGDVLVVKAKNGTDAAKLKSRFGFAESQNLYSRGTVQCGGNPWEASEVAGQSEPERLASWLTSQNAATSDVGFANRTESFAVCAACSCSRGDLAIAIGSSPVESDELGGLGFTPLH